MTASRVHYAAGAKMREARAQYFARNDFGDGGYEKRWVRLAAGPVPLGFPNSAARVRAVRLHDLHHVLTGYDTTWLGEAEIGAWEIASGCARHAVAWWLNLNALAIGLWISPRALLHAFARGRRSRNLYRESFREALLETTVGELRARLALDRAEPRPELADRVGFACWSAAAIAASLAGAVALVAPLALLARALWSS